MKNKVTERRVDTKRKRENEKEKERERENEEKEQERERQGKGATRKRERERERQFLRSSHFLDANTVISVGGPRGEEERQRQQEATPRTCGVAVGG